MATAAAGGLAARWRGAEHQLYPLLLNDPAAYRRGVLAVRALADELASAASGAALEAAWPAYAEPGGRAAEVLAGSGAGAGDAFLAELVAGAAFALRARELAAEVDAAAIAGRIAAAVAAGDEWVVLREVGRREHAAFGAYRRLEIHLPDGAGLHLCAEVSPEHGRPVFAVEAVALDPASGRPRAEVAQRREATDLAGWAEDESRMRDAVVAAAAGLLTGSEARAEDEPAVEERFL